jgi:hypothetical protein
LRRAWPGAGNEIPTHRGDEGVPQLDRAIVIEALLPHQRLPGGERDRVPDRGPSAELGGSAKLAARHQRVERRDEVAAERCEALGDDRLGELVAKQVLEHLLGAPIEGV